MIAAQTTSAPTTNLFLLEDLQDVSRTEELAESGLGALRAVADWIKTFVVKFHKISVARGPFCPFVPGSLERKTLWLAPEQIADREVPEVAELMSGYKRPCAESPRWDHVILGAECCGLETGVAPSSFCERIGA